MLPGGGDEILFKLKCVTFFNHSPSLMQLLKKGLYLEPDIFTNDLASWQLWPSYKWEKKTLDLELFNIELTPNPLLTKTD